jgi:hypothetical protein
MLQYHNFIKDRGTYITQSHGIVADFVDGIRNLFSAIIRKEEGSLPNPKSVSHTTPTPMEDTHLELVSSIQHDRVSDSRLQVLNLLLYPGVPRDTLAAFCAVCAAAGSPLVQMSMDIVRVDDGDVVVAGRVESSFVEVTL